MENFNERKLKLLKNIGKLVKAIDDEVDWYIASCTEKSPIRRKLAKEMFHEMEKRLRQLAKEAYVCSK
jgi:hypothetical protein